MATGLAAGSGLERLGPGSALRAVRDDGVGGAGLWAGRDGGRWGAGRAPLR